MRLAVCLAAALPLLVGGSWANPSCVPHWHVLMSHNPLFYSIRALEASSRDNVWVVGDQQVGESDYLPVVERWDGRRWRRSTNGLGRNVSVGDVAVISPDDVWAVGDSFDRASGKTDGLLTHWDGRSWTAAAPVRVPEADPPYDATVESVLAITSSDVWAILVVSSWRIRERGRRSSVAALRAALGRDQMEAS